MARQVTNAVLAEKIDNLACVVGKIDKILIGNGDPDKALVTRVDRLEQVEKVRKWVIRTVATSTFGMVATGLYKIFFGAE